MSEFALSSVGALPHRRSVYALVVPLLPANATSSHFGVLQICSNLIHERWIYQNRMAL